MRFSAAARPELLPFAPLAIWCGARLVRVIPVETFYKVTYSVLAVVALKLLYGGAAGLL